MRSSVIEFPEPENKHECLQNVAEDVLAGFTARLYSLQQPERKWGGTKPHSQVGKCCSELIGAVLVADHL